MHYLFFKIYLSSQYFEGKQIIPRTHRTIDIIIPRNRQNNRRRNAENPTLKRPNLFNLLITNPKKTLQNKIVKENNKISKKINKALIIILLLIIKNPTIHKHNRPGKEKNQQMENDRISLRLLRLIRTIIDSHLQQIIIKSRINCDIASSVSR